MSAIRPATTRGRTQRSQTPMKRSIGRQVVLAVLLWVALDVVKSASAQPPDPGKYSAEQFEVRATRGHKAPMRGGVRLSVDVFQPEGEGKFPAILIITPYSNNPGYQTR